VLPLPGASSVVTALSAAGDATGAERGFRFDGFLPAKGRERQARIEALAAQPLTTVLFEAPHRIEALVAALAAACPQRGVTLARELTKQFESFHTDAAAALPAWLAGDAHRARGEFVVVLHALDEADGDAADAEVDRLLAVLMRELPLRQAAALTAELSGRPRKQVYQAALDRRAAEPVGEDDEPSDDAAPGPG
jgi:16S rRNA (cytidine1402-2'-O)-methyltransferase